MIDNFFSSDGIIRATLPGQAHHASEGEQRRKPTRSRDQFAYPHWTREQLGAKRIRLVSGCIVRVRDTSSEEFLAWYLAQLRCVACNNNSYGHIRDTILAGINTSTIDMVAKWYLLEEMMHLPRYPQSGVQLFVEDEQQDGAA